MNLMAGPRGPEYSNFENQIIYLFLRNHGLGRVELNNKPKEVL